ncbi:HGxxPAAW family protein [Streptomyces coelicoflavus]|uniref:HGxxPAAW family protein n=1 Tax=Streptomyces coelicoflavus TaxID=285562 RepID=UPI0036BD1D70
MSGRHHDEGNTIAGWAGTALGTIGAVVTGLGVVGWRPGLWVGLFLIVAAAPATWLLHLAGWGKGPGIRPMDQRAVGARDLSAREGHPGCLGCRLAGRGRAARPHAVEPSASSPASASPSTSESSA